MSVKLSIKQEIEQKMRQQGQEITKEDVGKHIDFAFGQVLSIDIGKKIWLKSYGITMENNEQRDKRKSN